MRERRARRREDGRMEQEREGGFSEEGIEIRRV
jgi:hypothetical protein